MDYETPNTKFPRDIKDPSSDYGGSDVDDVVLEAEDSASQSQLPQHASADNEGTDYGSDFDSEADEQVTRLLTELDGVRVVTEPLIEIEPENESGRQCLVHVPLVPRAGQGESGRTRGTSWHRARESAGSTVRTEHTVADDIDLPDPSTLSRVSEGQENGPSVSLFPLPEQDQERSAEAVQANDGISTAPSDRGETPVTKDDQKTPIERFRRAPKKPLSVTDIVSPAWCELQYWFSLTKFGKVKRTPAMKQGTKVHKELEEQVHTYVQIEVKTREDTFGLRIWNIIQGLRTLRASGLTRELEIWGILDGEVVNGVIDELSFECPDPELEESIELSKLNDVNQLPPGQKTIGDFYASQSHPHSAWLGNPHTERKVYVTDIKTRATKYMPQGAALRGVQMQLMLYHKLLADLASNVVSADTIFDRYKLDAHIPFTPVFIKNIAALEDNFIHLNNNEDNEASLYTLEDQLSELAQHNSLTRLWSLMIMEFQRTFPTTNALSPILQVEYRRSKDGKVMGNKCFVYDAVMLEKYTSKTMDWWMGRREVRGVDIEEAFKCQACEFAPECTWRKEKVEEGIKKFREKRRVGEKKWSV